MIEYREGEAEVLAAVKKALAINCTASRVDNYFYGWDGSGGVVAKDALVDLFMTKFVFAITQSLRKGGAVQLRGFGMFFVDKRMPFMASGAVSGYIRAAKMPRFKPSESLAARVGKGIPAPGP